MKPRIYLDNNATTFLDPYVLKIIIKELNEEDGNPSSVHYHGRLAKKKLESSRERIASFLKVKSNEIVFTSGGTEGANLLLQGFFESRQNAHLITSNVEHSSVYNTAKKLEKKGVQVDFLPAKLWGAVLPDSVKEAIRPNTALISLMAVNNETGVKTDIEAIAKIAYEANIPFIVDGVALLGKETVTLFPGISAMFFSGHKFHAPKGTGFFFLNRNFKIPSLLTGATQESNHRPGTENLNGIVGLAAAVECLNKNQLIYSETMRQMRDRLENGLKSQLSNVLINGQGPRVVNLSNLSFIGVDGESLLMLLDQEGISVSHGSACSSGALEPSRILANMLVPLEQSRSAIRFSVSRFTTPEEIDRAIEIIVSSVRKLRKNT